MLVGCANAIKKAEKDSKRHTGKSSFSKYFKTHIWFFTLFPRSKSREQFELIGRKTFTANPQNKVIRYNNICVLLALKYFVVFVNMLLLVNIVRTTGTLGL